MEKLIEAKRNGKKVTPIRQPKAAPVMDLMEALQQSLSKNKAASASKAESSSSKTTGKKATARKRTSKVA